VKGADVLYCCGILITGAFSTKAAPVFVCSQNLEPVISAFTTSTLAQASEQFAYIAPFTDKNRKVLHNKTQIKTN